MGDEKIEGTKSDLHSLKKLYGLLQTNGHGLQDEISNLDDKSRLLLKNLLDDAANKVINAHSEIISTALGDTLNHQPYSLTNISPEVTHHGLQSTKLGVNVEKFALHNKDKRNMTPSMPSIIQPLTNLKQSSPYLDKSNISFSNATSESRTRKRCRFCRQSSVKQLRSTTLILPNNESQNLRENQLNGIPTTFCFGIGGPNKELGFTDQAKPERNLESQNQSRSISSEFKRNPLEADDAEFGVKHNFTAQEDSKTIELIESCIMALQKVVSLAKQVEPQGKKNLSPKIGLSFRADSSTITESRDIKSFHLNHLLEKEVPNQPIANQNAKAILEKMESLKLAASKNGYNLPGQHANNKMIASRSSTSSPDSSIHHRKAGQLLSFNKKKNNHLLISSESDGASSSLEYSSSGATREEDVSSRSSVSRRGSSVNTGDSLSEYYRSFTSGSNDVGPTSSSDSLASGSGSLASKYNHDCPSYGKSKRPGFKQKGNWTKPAKRIGRMKKLKDKLAIIFHHHHHHHYHHQQQHKDSKEKEALKERKAVKKVVRKSMVEKEGNFRGLVNGLLDQLKHKKKSKVGIKKFEKGKKLHWWQILRQQKRGAKLPKLGYGSRS